MFFSNISVSCLTHFFKQKQQSEKRERASFWPIWIVLQNDTCLIENSRKLFSEKLVNLKLRNQRCIISSWAEIQNVADSERIPCSSVWFLVRSPIEYKILLFLEGIQRSGEWNTKSCKETEIPCRPLQGECILSTRPARNRCFPCKIFYSLSTRDVG